MTIIDKAISKAKMPWRRFWLWLNWKHEYKCIVTDKQGYDHEFLFHYRTCLGKRSMWISFSEYVPGLGRINKAGPV